MSRWSILALAFCSSATACSDKEARPARQVILIVLDAARAERFGAHGYSRETTPNMDGMAERGIWFENHYAQATATRRSIPNLIYSRYFTKELFPGSASVPFETPEALMRRLDDEAISLPQTLSKAGFKTAAVSAHTWLRPGTRFATEFDELYDLSSTLSYPKKYGHPRADQVVDRTIRWISRHRRDDYFLYVHLMDTHFPHFFGKDAEYFFRGTPRHSNRLKDNGWPTDSNRDALSTLDRRYLDALYDGSLRYADREIGRLVNYLDGKGLLSTTLIVITADHGEHLLETSGRFTHGGPWYDAVSRVPLILHYPSKLQPKRVPWFSESVDVFPTVIGLMGVSLPPGKAVDGVNLVEVSETGADQRLYAFAPSGVRDKRFKAIFLDPPAILLLNPAPEVLNLTGELYDVVSDPFERTDLWESQPEQVDRLLGFYREHLTSSFERAAAAVNHEQPESLFAISSGHFELGHDVPTPLEALSPGRLAMMETSAGWIRSTTWPSCWLLASPGSPPLRIEFPIPNGVYRVTVHIRGRARFQFENGEAVELHGSDYEPGSKPNGEAVDAGHVTINGERLRAVIRPVGSDFFVLEMIGFQPLGKGTTAEREDDDLLERLKTLGYVQDE